MSHALKKKLKIKENFLGFVKTFDSTGQVLYDIIAKILEMKNIPIANMIGQDIDNHSNIKGEKNGLQSMFLKVNPCVSFVPYSAHPLNFIINDASKVNSGTLFSFFSRCK